ncbi:unnamed protein product [Darwinula stevensoni]|uniref:cGMP-dependent protein kinase interacting domain-containing protein n=1 Tax=Darwinula stevensoni TaxID=69355 RepID=A0A7R9A6R4_9CRUS|nr:unnamed protein product [Darwinula stevensoni]CAG0890097.1 unnamed protein product [Darwinula stevensoni]
MAMNGPLQNLSERGTGSIRSNRDRSYGGLSTTTSAPPSVAGDSRPPSRGQENGEIDYKKPRIGTAETIKSDEWLDTQLYEEAMVENERLKERLRKADDELSSSRSQLDKALQMNSARNSLSDVDKREKRALERKLSEMEEELKQLQKLKAENEKLKAENRALTRVVSKLTSNQSVTATKAEENGKDDSPQ